MSRFWRALGTVLGFLVLVQIPSSVDRHSRYVLHPTPDSAAPFGVYVPRDLEDCLKELQHMLSPELQWGIRAAGPRVLSEYHLGLGMWIRNNWGLWQGSRLSRYFNSLGIHHPDDMSGIILTSLCRRLNEKSPEMEGQVKMYQGYWQWRRQRPRRETPDKPLP